ncbi:hypothetical protein [Azospirillum sp. SYSU D00513]|uniref:hypothetical protein n=1 Tax=Azospirillum sp. SYSU D00513 TaxID=2812561 RepID=UPI0024941720|nr:hypothetical protein [Azospirillum sp. SYSU D00513]
MRLPYEIKDDDHYPRGGVAAVVIPAAAGRASGPVDVVIAQEDPESPYLGQRGWQAVEYRWQASPVRDEGTDLVVSLGERVTALIEDFTPVRILLPDLKLEGQAMWQGVTPPSTAVPPAGDPSARGGSSFLTPVTVAPPPPPPPPPPTPSPPPPPPPPPVEVVQPVVVQPVEPEPEPVVSESQTETVPVSPPPDTPPPDTPPPDRNKTGRSWLLPVILLVLIVAAAFAAFLLYPQGEEQTAAAPQPAPSQTPAPPAAPAPPPPPLTLAELHERGLAAAAAGNADEAWRQFRRPEAESYGPTLLHLAQALDSVEFAPGLYREPNDIAALQLYARACAAGETGASAALGRLETEITRRADEGDVLASEALRLEVPKAKNACR